MEPLSPILNDQPLEGVVAVQREVSTGRGALIVGPGLDHALEAVRYACERWSGCAQLLAPQLDVSDPHRVKWDRLLAEADIDFVKGFGVTKDELPNIDQRGPWPDGLAAVLATLDKGRESLKPIVVPELCESDPWYVAYLAILGSLPNAPAWELIRYRFSDELAYSDLFELVREQTVGSAADLWSRVDAWQRSDPVTLTRIALSCTPPRVSGTRGTGVLPVKDALANRIGPHIVVVYAPGSIEDLCLTWCLRASNGWGHAPLAAPDAEDVVETIRGWQKEGARFPAFMGRTPGCALTSTSVPVERLQAYASALGANWMVVPPDDLLRAGDIPARRSSEVVTFTEGRARVFGWSQADMTELGRKVSARGLDTRVRLRPLTQELPPSPSLAGGRLFAPIWRGGAFEIVNPDLSTPEEMFWPVGWTVLEAVARDRGLTIRRSSAGVAAEALVARVGSLEETVLLAHPDVTEMLYRLCERTGMTFFKNKVGPLIAEVRACEEMGERADRLEAHLQAIAASASDARLHTVTIQNVPKTIGTQKQIVSWLEWAEGAGILIRGVQVVCSNCGHQQWNALSEIAPPITCRGCAIKIQRPFRADQVQFHYRATETLLRVVAEDALGHVLTLHWVSGLFQRVIEGPEDLVGGHPGVEFLDKDGTVIGEADVLLLFCDGGVAVGEYKRTPGGLTQRELEKLDHLARALGADWTFVATHEEASRCTPLWQDCQQGLPQPRFALTGDHLYRPPIWEAGTNPFAWPSDDGGSRGKGPAMRPAEIAERIARFKQSDSFVHDAWRFEDD